MKDAEIYHRFDTLSDMVSQDVHNLQRGISMVRTREDAIERLLFGSRFGIVKVMLLQLLSPRLLAKTVQKVHSEEIERYNVSRREAAKKSAIKAAPQPGMLLVH